jgi:hypothetical protein
MLLSQIITPFAYAVSGEEVSMPEPIVKEIAIEPEEVEPESTLEGDNFTGDNNFELDELST